MVVNWPWIRKKVEILLYPWWVIIRCAAVGCLITKYIIAVYFCTCLFYGAPVVRVSFIYIRVCTHVGLFYYRLGLRAFSVVDILRICEIKTKPTNGRVVVYKQIAGLYVIRILNISFDSPVTPTSTTYW